MSNGVEKLNTVNRNRDSNSNCLCKVKVSIPHHYFEIRIVGLYFSSSDSTKNRISSHHKSTNTQQRTQDFRKGGGRKFENIENNEDQNENFPTQNQVRFPAQN